MPRENMAPLFLFPVATVLCLVNVAVGLNISSAAHSLHGLSKHKQPIKARSIKEVGGIFEVAFLFNLMPHLILWKSCKQRVKLGAMITLAPE